jgi:hypothetical protein
LIDPILHTIGLCNQHGTSAASLLQFTAGERALAIVEAALEEIDELRSLSTSQTLLDQPLFRKPVDQAYDALAAVERHLYKEAESR